MSRGKRLNIKILKYPGVLGIFVFSILIFSFLAFPSSARADYPAQGVLASTNILSGATGVTAISDFKVTATIPAGTTVSVQFSQDNSNFYNSSGTLGGVDSCANGTTTVNLSGLNWTGAILFYKLQLATTNSTLTPTVTAVQLDYTGTAVPAVTGVTYPVAGTVMSANMLSGASVSAINSFAITANIPPGTFASVQFSQDGSNFYNSSGTAGGFDSCVNGTTTVNLSGLNWSGGSLFYKLQLGSPIDNEQTPTVTSVQVGYTGTVPQPPGGNTYPIQGTLVSTDLLSGGANGKLTATDQFVYALKLPYGTGAQRLLFRRTEHCFKTAKNPL
ncbi:MAG: hypothetical protein P4L62_02940 [Candidatus Pacebacteria bacterium]|nr:hypothetical protein [Candidatus Paceibacterota bacterium]MDR3583290.1 hypothetical protein [Candidatus Paceibacterota bacterium]